MGFAYREATGRRARHLAVFTAIPQPEAPIVQGLAKGTRRTRLQSDRQNNRDGERVKT